ncbi:MAG TPA: AAA family ATPase [Ktedonobacteraceae bacterium]|nr:AAA family ATPase [Ktedonobacteraceae bacterium]
MLKRVKVQGYKSLADVEVSLEPLTMLFGPNTAGKSNFLDVLQLLSRIATSRTLRDAFDLPYRGTPIESFTLKSGGVQALLSQEKVSCMIEVDVELSSSVVETVNQQLQKIHGIQVAPVREKFVRYSIDIEIQPRSGLLAVANEYVTTPLTEGSATEQSFTLKRGETDLRVGKQNLSDSSLLRPEQSILSVFHPLQALYPHLTALREELASWRFYYLEPRERMRLPSPVKDVRYLGLMGEDIAAYLNTLCTVDETAFNAVERALNKLIPTITGIDVSVNENDEVLLRVMEGDIPIPARLLSDGTLRILGLLALQGIKDQPTLIGFEEPENGIYPGRLNLIVSLLRTLASEGTQIITTTHSPVLPDYTPRENLYVCRRDGMYARIDPLSIWRENENHSTEGKKTSTLLECMLRGDFEL